MAKKVILGKVDLTGVSEDYAWYTVITLFNNEEKYVENVQNAVRGSMYEHLIAEYLVPIHYSRVSTRARDGKVRTRTSKVKGCYSTYVFIKAMMTDGLWNFLRTIPGIAVVLSTGGQPVALAEEEVEHIRRDCAPTGFTEAELAEHEALMREKFVMIDTGARVDLPFNVGQCVETVGGSTGTLSGRVQQVFGQMVVVDFDGFSLTVNNNQLRAAGANLVV